MRRDKEGEGRRHVHYNRFYCTESSASASSVGGVGESACSRACCGWLRLPPRLPVRGTGFGCAGPARLNCWGLLFCIHPRICSTSSPCSCATRTTSGLPTRNFQLQCSARRWRALFCASLNRVPLADTVREADGGADGAVLLELKGAPAAAAAAAAAPPPAIWKEFSMPAMKMWGGMKEKGDGRLDAGNDNSDEEGREADD